MTTSDERRGLTEPLESVTTFFGALMIFAVLAGVALILFGSGAYSVVSSTVCATEAGTQYGIDGHDASVIAGPSVTPRPGNSIAMNGALQVCADHATLGEQALNLMTALPTVLFWGSVLFLLWRIIVTARRNGPFTRRVAAAMRRLGWFIIIGSTTAAAVHLIAVDVLLTTMAEMADSPFQNLILVPVHMPIPVLTGAALLTFARIVKAGAAMDEEIQATI